ncbi:MAG: UDP-glucose--hexose-1-phosphate uridylyltransferase [Candidatus Acidiferrales bacterium]
MLNDAPHRRFNPLTRDWVLVSPQRADRPWQGKIEKAAGTPSVQYDPDCYLCPGNLRAGGQRNPAYSGTFVFNNDFPALVPETPSAIENAENLLLAQSEPGVCRVACFSPRHDLTLSRMKPAEIEAVVRMWMDQARDLAAVPWIRYIQIFENRGSLMGASNPHPHCQIWTDSELPNIPAKEQESQKDFLAREGQCLLCRYLALEMGSGVRVVCQNNSFTAVVPFWALWPFETLILSRRHLGAFEDLSPVEQVDLADILRRVTIRYDNLFEASFPYSMGFHPRPSDGQPHPEWHFHAHYFPPLLRSATVQKFIVGYELLATPQRDITAEIAAARLREMSEKHYLDRTV